jgi:hypothetical protein
MLRLPVRVEVEYRGARPGGEFVDKETGEVVPFGPSLRFEYESDDGEPVLIPLGSKQLDKASGSDKLGELEKGDRIVLVGSAMIADRNSQRDSFFVVESVERLASTARTAKPAAVAS